MRKMGVRTLPNLVRLADAVPKRITHKHNNISEDADEIATHAGYSPALLHAPDVTGSGGHGGAARGVAQLFQGFDQSIGVRA